MTHSLAKPLGGAANLVAAIGWVACASAQTNLPPSVLDRWTCLDMGGGASFPTFSCGMSRWTRRIRTTSTLPLPVTRPGAGTIPGPKASFYSRDGGLTWKQANEGLSWPFAATIAVDPNDPSYVFLGSPGLGFQRRRFSDLIRLRLNGPSVQNGTCQLSWNSESGWTYKVLRKTLLADVWTELAVVPSAGTVTGYSDALSSAGPTFYQVSGLSQ